MKSLIFTGEMVRAILNGRKTQTRRIVKPQPRSPAAIYSNDQCSAVMVGPAIKGPRRGIAVSWCWRHNAIVDATRGPISSFDIGETVYVRETWAPIQGMSESPDNIMFREGTTGYKGKWCSPLHLRESAARFFLLIESVRVERLQAISEEDAKAEGITEDFPAEECNSDRPFREGYSIIWRSIHGRESWDLNPWVWVYTFRRVER